MERNSFSKSFVGLVLCEGHALYYSLGLRYCFLRCVNELLTGIPPVPRRSALRLRTVVLSGKTNDRIHVCQDIAKTLTLPIVTLFGSLGRLVVRICFFIFSSPPPHGRSYILACCRLGALANPFPSIARERIYMLDS